MSPASSGQGTCYSDEYGTDYNKIAERELSGENMSSLRAYYDSGAGDAITWGDTVYGSLWGDPAYTTGGVHTVSTDRRKSAQRWQPMPTPGWGL